MTKQEATQYVAEKLTGQTLADAKVTAKNIIEKIATTNAALNIAIVRTPS